MDILPLAQWLLESVAAQAGESEHFFLRLARAYELTAPPRVELVPAWASRAYRVDVIVETNPVAASSSR